MKIKKILFILCLMLFWILLSSTFVLGVEIYSTEKNVKKTYSSTDRPLYFSYTFDHIFQDPNGGERFTKSFTTILAYKGITKEESCDESGTYNYQAEGNYYFTEDNVSYQLTYKIIATVTVLPKRT